MQKVPAGGRGALPRGRHAGREALRELGCLNCHTYLGTGGAYLGAPDLTAIGTKNRASTFQIDHLKNPRGVNPGSPIFASLGKEKLDQIAFFLAHAKGVK